jgi:hypothetical protein
MPHALTAVCRTSPLHEVPNAEVPVLSHLLRRYQVALSGICTKECLSGRLADATAPTTFFQRNGNLMKADWRTGLPSKHPLYGDVKEKTHTIKVCISDPDLFTSIGDQNPSSVSIFVWISTATSSLCGSCRRQHQVETSHGL